MSDGILTRQEEERVRTFRDNLALDEGAADSKTLATLDRASSDRIMMEARLAAISVHDGEQHLQELMDAIRQAGLDPGETTRLLIRAWEAAVEGALEDGLVSLDEESVLAKYTSHFNLTQQDLDGNGAQTSLVQAAVIRDVTQGIVPQRQTITGAVPFNLMKSEQLVWVIQGVDYLETVVRRERQGTSHGLSIRVARGLYRPSTFPEPPHRVGGDRPRWHRAARAHDQAHLLRRKAEAVPGPVRQNSRLRALQRWVRHHAGRPDRQAPDLLDRGRLVRLQPGREPGATPSVRLRTPAPRRVPPTGARQLWKQRAQDRELPE